MKYKKRGRPKKQNYKSIEQIVQEVEEYNKRNNTAISYGKYVSTKGEGYELETDGD